MDLGGIQREDCQGLLANWIWRVRERKQSKTVSWILTSVTVWMLTPLIKMDNTGGGRIGQVVEGQGKGVV